MGRDDYKKVLTDLKYFAEECDDIDELRIHMKFLINMNRNCMETIHYLSDQLKEIKEFLTNKKLISRKLSHKDITPN